MVGRYVDRVFADRELLLTDVEEWDVCNYEQGVRLFREKRPQLVIHLAAETDVDRCEREPDHAYRTNVVATHYVARLAAEHGAELVYVSTTGIFGGEKPEPYTEFDQPNPLNVYAKSKFEAERVAARMCPRCYIVRAGWMFGGGVERDKKFVGKIVSLCREHDEIRIVNDKVGSPTYASDFVQAMRQVIEMGFYGAYHLTNDGSGTRYNIACEIVRILGLKTRVLPVSSAVFPAPALRPRNDAAHNYYAELLGLPPMRPWQQALEEYLREWQES